MRAILAIALALAAGPLPAVGQRQAEAQSGTVTMSRDDCRRLVQYHPDAGIAYQAGVDVHGKPVAPADLARSDNGGAPQKITIDLKIPLGQLPNNNAPAELGRSYVNTGQVSVDLNDGSVTVNGRKIGAEGDAAVLDACRKAGAR